MRFPPDPPRAVISRHHEGRSARRLQHRARRHSRRSAKWRLLQVSQGFTTSTVRARWLRDLIAPESVDRGMQDFTFFLQRVRSGREGERQDREDDDRGRRRGAALGAIGAVPRNAARPDMMRSG